MEKFLVDTADHCKELLADITEIEKQSNRYLTGVHADIRQFRKMVNKRFDEMEREAIFATVSLQCRSIGRITKAKEAHDQINELAQLAVRESITDNTSERADKHFNADKNIRIIRNCLDELIDLVISPAKEYQFYPDPFIFRLLQNDQSLGLIENSGWPKFYPPISKPLCLGNILVHSRSDINRSWVTGMALLNSKSLIITDKDNNTVKVVSLEQMSTTNLLKLDSSPWDVTKVGFRTCAVTLPFRQCIQHLAYYASYSTGRLAKTYEMKVKGMCYGIAYHMGKLIVSFQDPAKLHIMNMNGDVLNTVTTNSRGENLFIHPNFVIANNSYIYVSDWKQHSVIRLNWQGDQIASYRGIENPQGIALVEDGSLFVSDYSDDKCNVLHISGDFIEAKISLEDLNKPFSLCWNVAQSELYISSGSGDEKYDNFIQMFRMPTSTKDSH